MSTSASPRDWIRRELRLCESKEQMHHSVRSAGYIGLQMIIVVCYVLSSTYDNLQIEKREIELEMSEIET